jgi:hypothetical protein
MHPFINHLALFNEYPDPSIISLSWPGAQPDWHGW